MRSEHAGGGGHWDCRGERSVGDGDGLAWGSGVSDCRAGAWHDQGGGAGAHGGVALDGGGAVDDAGAGDWDTWGENCGFGKGAGAGCDGEGLASGGGICDVVLHDGGGLRAVGSVACDDLGCGGGVWGGCYWG